MLQLRFYSLLLSCVAFCLAPADCVCAQDGALRSSKPDQDIVVLRNGGVLHGRTVDQGNACIVYLGGKSEIRLPQGAIDFVCESLQQAYEIQRDRNSADDPDAPIELAAWCVRHDLLAQASTELERIQEAAKLDFRIHGLLQQIASKRRLQQAQALARPLVALPQVEEKLENSSDARLPQVSSQSIGLFNTSVQSRLLNGCAAGGCHGANSASAFQLACESPSRPATRRMTFENFAACFKLIDRANPEKSKLLNYASTPHANLKAPVYRQGSRHYEAIANWVKTAVLSENGGMAANQSQTTSGQVRLASAHEELQNGSLPDDLANGETPMTMFPAASAQNPNGGGQHSLGIDPFDPEVFNRLYGAQPAVQTGDENGPLANDSFGSETATTLQAPRRLSDSQKEGAMQIGASKN